MKVNFLLSALLSSIKKTMLTYLRAASVCCAVMLLGTNACANSEDDANKEGERGTKHSYDIVYHITLSPKEGLARVDITIDNAERLKWLRFSIDETYHKGFVGNGTLIPKNGTVEWAPPAENAKLSYEVVINRPRKGKAKHQFDAYMAEGWAIFRGDDVIPPATVRTIGTAYSNAQLVFTLPEEWESVNTGWPKDRNTKVPNSYLIDNPERRFDRPTGWVIAGNLGTRRATLGGTYVGVSAPTASHVRRMDILMLTTFAWPEVMKTFSTQPDKLLIVGGGEPMWRGGLSSPNSFYLHEDRPLVSENGTSTVLHELFHVVSRISGAKGHDWIAEGLAEYYAIEWLFRAGGITEKRRGLILKDLEEWSSEVDSLKGKSSSGAKTAKAVLFFDDIDTRLKKQKKGFSLDDFIQPFQFNRDVQPSDIMARCEELEITCPTPK